MTLDVHVCCEIMAGIYRVSCLHWPHLDVGDVPYGSVCRESQHIAVFRIRFCSQSFVAYRFNIVVINSSSACVCVWGGALILFPTENRMSVRSVFLIPHFTIQRYFPADPHPLPNTHTFSFLTSLPSGESKPQSVFLLFVSSAV